MNDEVLRRELRRISIEANHRCFGCGFEHNCGIHGCAIVREALERLEEYRELGPIDHLRELTQAEKDGRLVVLPCNIHQPIYIVKNDEIHQNYGFQWHFTDKECQTFGTLSMYGEFVRLDDFGKTVFLTREEAEAALKKREAENEPD